jgi:phenylacetic acid degradation operon negative regulatory protein
VQSFRRQRPLRGGSLLVTIFGDAIAPRGGAVTLGSLIALAAPFGLNERLVRTSAARLANEGWLTTRRSGRRSEYRLSVHGERRFAEATRRIYAANPVGWSGGWTLLLLEGGTNGRQERLREELAWLGFGQVGGAVLAHPTLAAADLAARLREHPRMQRSIVLSANALDEDANRRFVERGWNLADLGRRYRRFLRLFEPVRGALRAGGNVDPRLAFIVRTLLIHEYRKVHLRDPLLPLALMPREWIGRLAYELCGELYRTVLPAAEAHLSATGERLEGALPAPDASIRGRFERVRAHEPADD